MENIKETVKIYIMYGLPASGKTYWCSRQYRKETSRYIDMDEYYLSHKQSCDRKSFAEWTEDMLIEKIEKSYRQYIYIDGIISDVKSAAAVAKAAIDIVESNGFQASIWVMAFNEDRETCLYNDTKRDKSGRFDMNSTTTIKNLPYEEITARKLSAELGDEYSRKALFVGVSKLTVSKKPEYKKFFTDEAGLCLREECLRENKSRFTQTDFLYSDTWTLGGVHKSYTGSCFPLDAETPCEFTQLYDLLLGIDEYIPFKLVREIVKELVTYQEWQEDDYYGGYTTYAKYAIKLDDLYGKLSERYGNVSIAK